METNNNYSSILDMMKTRNKKLNTKLTVSYLIIVLIGITFIFTAVYASNVIADKDAKIKELTIEYKELKRVQESKVEPNNDTLETEPIVDDRDELPEKYNSVPLDDDLKKYIYKSAIEANIPAEIVFSVAWRESGFNPDAKSNTNDHGMFQINECNFSRLAKNYGYTYNEMCTKIYDPYVNTDCAIYILKEYRDNYSNDNWHHVLMRYNMGPGRAASLFNSGKYSSEYSRAIVSYAQDNFGLTDITIG